MTMKFLAIGEIVRITKARVINNRKGHHPEKHHELEGCLCFVQDICLAPHNKDFTGLYRLYSLDRPWPGTSGDKPSDWWLDYWNGCDLQSTGKFVTDEELQEYATRHNFSTRPIRFEDELSIHGHGHAQDMAFTLANLGVRSLADLRWVGVYDEDGQIKYEKNDSARGQNR